MRTFVVSDIHGYYRTFVTLLSRLSYNPSSDRLILLGDYVDGGPASLEVVRLVQQLVKNANVHAIGGNHDDMFLNWLDDQDYLPSPYTLPKNGGLQTIHSFCPWYNSEMDDTKAREYINKQYFTEISFFA